MIKEGSEPRALPGGRSEAESAARDPCSPTDLSLRMLLSGSAER